MPIVTRRGLNHSKKGKLKRLRGKRRSDYWSDSTDKATFPSKSTENDRMLGWQQIEQSSVNCCLIPAERSIRISLSSPQVAH